MARLDITLRFAAAGEGIPSRTYTNLRVPAQEAFISRVFAGAHWNQVRVTWARGAAQLQAAVPCPPTPQCSGH